jgi:CDP-paratose 2-epimerase
VTPADRPVLITGGAGFIGTNLADRLAHENHHVLIYDALKRPGVQSNLDWLRQRHPSRITPILADICNAEELGRAVAQAGVVFHLAAQVAVTTSLEDPISDFRTNLHGTVLLLEAVRRCGREIPLIFASTNKVYGGLADLALRLDEHAYLPEAPAIRMNGISESRPLEFHTPYGCSKGAADQYVLDYARSFSIPTVVFRMSCIYGPRQMGTEDQGWVAHFLIRALQGRPISIFGDGCQVRDIFFVDDAVDAYVAAWRRMSEIRGKAFNLGGGPANAVSLRQVLSHIETICGTPLQLLHGEWRAGDQRYYVSDTRMVTRALGLPPPTPWRTGIATLAAWLRAKHGESRASDVTNDSPIHPAEALP